MGSRSDLGPVAEKIHASGVGRLAFWEDFQKIDLGDFDVVIFKPARYEKHGRWMDLGLTWFDIFQDTQSSMKLPTSGVRLSLSSMTC